MKRIALLITTLLLVWASANGQTVKKAEGTSPARRLEINGISGKGHIQVDITAPQKGQLFNLMDASGSKGLKPKKEIKVKGTIDYQGKGIKKVEVNGNSALIDPTSGRFAETIRLPLGRHQIGVKAVSREGLSATKTRYITIKEKIPIDPEWKKRDLYVLSIGISDFDNNEGFNDLQYAHQDALDIADYFKRMENKIYSEVKVKTYINEQATEKNIFQGLKWIENQPSSGSVAIIFMSTHGFNEDGDAYLMPYDGDIESLRADGIGVADVRKTVETLSNRNSRNCRVLLMLDACQSGTIGAKLAHKGAPEDINMDKALKYLDKDEYGVMSLYSSELDEDSYEDATWQNGAFTEAILEILEEGQGDNGDRIIYYNELAAYVKERVNELIQDIDPDKGQHPVQDIAPTITRFPVGIINP